MYIAKYWEIKHAHACLLTTAAALFKSTGNWCIGTVAYRESYSWLCESNEKCSYFIKRSIGNGAFPVVPILCSQPQGMTNLDIQDGWLLVWGRPVTHGVVRGVHVIHILFRGVAAHG